MRVLAAVRAWWGRRSRLGRAVIVCLALLLAFVILDTLAYPSLVSIGGRSLNTGRNGLWIRYTWYFGQWGPADLERLAGRLERHGIRYAYFHVRSAEENGSLKYRYDAQARRLNRAVGHRLPAVTRIAWVYVGNPRGAGRVDLSRPAVRKRLVEDAVWLVERCGFQGVQWDYEICPDGDRHLLALLEESRAAMPAGTHLSVASPVWLPIRAYGWSEAYYAEVARRCDQIAVMCYDTGMVVPRAYVALVRQQAVRVTRSVAKGNPRCGVVLGIPTYGPGFRSHNPRAENVRMALKGVREGLASPAAETGVFEGVAPFAEYTTDAREWATYERLWAR